MVYTVSMCELVLSVLRAKPARRPGGAGSHVHVLPAGQPAVARTEGRHTEGEIPEDWGY